MGPHTCTLVFCTLVYNHAVIQSAYTSNAGGAYLATDKPSKAGNIDAKFAAVIAAEYLIMAALHVPADIAYLSELIVDDWVPQEYYQQNLTARFSSQLSPYKGQLTKAVHHTTSAFSASYCELSAPSNTHRYLPVRCFDQ